MRCLLHIMAVVALVSARPEKYRETEDFQYSRSSTDEGSKSGFYGAQKGNMGGNYEKAHNMDALAQNQMGSAINQVQGEIVDAGSVPKGNVFTSANTKGIYSHTYPSGTNLQGRNFQEGVNYLDSQSSSNAGYGINSNSMLQNQRYAARSSYNTKSSGYTGYHANGEYAQNNQEALSRITGANQQVLGQNVYDQNDISRQSSQSSYGSNSQTRTIGAFPVRVVIRPGSTVNVPVYAEAHENAHGASYDANSIKSEAELLSNANNQQISGYQFSGQPKTYQSSYSYQKNWEKHDTQPEAVALAIPSVNPYPVNSELLENSQGSSGYHGTAQNHQYATGYKAAQHSSSQYQSGFNTQQTKNAGLNTHNSYNQIHSNAGLTAGAVDVSPKKYQSSYSYHKSWERQGDPYVISPITSQDHQLQASERLTASDSHYRSNKYGTHSRYASGGINADCDCDDDEHSRHIRSVHDDTQMQGKRDVEELTQQTQNKWDSEDLTQQTQQNHFGKLDDFGKQTQKKWDSEDLTQQTQQNHFGKIEDVGPQAQNKWDSEDLTQQTQQNHFGKFNDFGQQRWDSEDLTQQTQQNHFGKLEDFGQQTQNKWDSEDLTQQTQQNHFGKLEDFGQQTQNKWDSEDLTQQTQQNHFGNFEEFGQTQNKWDSEGLTQQTQQNNFGKLEIGQQRRNKWASEGAMQESSTNFNPSDINHQPSSNTNGHYNKHGKLDGFERQNLNKGIDMHDLTQKNENDKFDNLFQHSQSNIEDIGQQTNTNWDKSNTHVNQFISKELNNKPQYENKEVSQDDAVRGDIGAEVVPHRVTTEAQITYHIYDNTKPKIPKTPSEIEALSLTVVNSETTAKKNLSDETLSVIGINQQWLEEQKKINKENNQLFVRPTTKRPEELHQLFDFDQQNLQQQSQTMWEQNQEEYHYQVDSNGNTNNIQQQDLTQLTQNLEQHSDLTQQTEQLTSNGNIQNQREHFYEPKYHSSNSQSHNAQVQLEENTTPIPGFWKSVGNKLNSAKNKVSSWFSSTA